MRTLFIHPTDPSTAFCSAIYQDYLQWDNVTLITGNHISRNVLVEALRTHDRIVFLGHGTELGLLDMRYDWRYLITSRDLQFFRDKECICFWCNANIFAEKYDLNAFATGMFVSQLSEARQYNLPEDQNRIFDPIEQIRDTIYRGYVSTNNPIIQFNRECMGFNDI